MPQYRNDPRSTVMIFTFFLIVFLAVAPASGYLRTDDSISAGDTGSTVIKKPSGKFGGTEKITLTFTGFDGSAPVIVPLTLPADLAGIIDHAELYISDASIAIDNYELAVIVHYSDPVYTDAECAAFRDTLGGSWTVEEERTFTDAQRRQIGACWFNDFAVDYVEISHVLTTNLWENDWSAGTSGGTVGDSVVFLNSDRLMLTGSEFSETVTISGTDDATETVEVSTLKNQHPIGTSVSRICPLSNFTGEIGADRTLPVTTYWELSKGEESAALTSTVTVKIDLYVY